MAPWSSWSVAVRGMGLATAQAASVHGAKVTIASRSPEKLRDAASRLEADARFVIADVRSEADVQRMFADLPSVDHVFVAAGQFIAGGVLDTELERLRLDVQQRFSGPIFVVKHAAPKMVAGSITFMSGQLGSRPTADDVVTSAMHAAIETLAKGLALELAPVRVNVVAPGLIDTPLLGDSRGQAAEWVSSALPVRRIGRPEEVAQAVITLMTNDFITGDVLQVDGGGRYV
jgi:NAD(P)-dependent dehydrogenase (short-subunit alcohol dehydrogenase family)